MQLSLGKARRMTVLRALGLAISAPAMFMLAAPASSSAAAAPSPGVFLTVADKSSGVFLTSTLPSNFAVGDCVALAGSAIRLQRFSNSTAFLTWGQTSFTTHTTRADVWHGTFRFLNAAGQTVYTVSSLDGAPMSQVGRLYNWLVTSPDRLMSASTYASIIQVQWEGRC